MLFTAEQYKGFVSREFRDEDFVGAMNGDGATCDAHVEGITRMNGDFYAVLNKHYEGLIRVNWFIYAP